MDFGAWTQDSLMRGEISIIWILIKSRIWFKQPQCVKSLVWKLAADLTECDDVRVGPEMLAILD